MKIKVLRIITRLNVGGPTIHVVLLNSKLNSKEYETLLLSGKTENHESDMYYYAEKYGLEPIYIDTMSREIRLIKDFKALVAIIKVIKRFKPDIVHTHTAKAGLVGRLAAILMRVPLIIHTFHGNIFKNYFGKFKTHFFIMIERALARYTTKIIAISRQQKDELVNLKICEKEKIEIINLGFDFENVLPNRTHINSFRDEYNIPSEMPLVGIIGRLTPIKNHMMFLEICEKILKIHKEIIFVIVGDGELRGNIEKEILRRKLESNVILTGNIQDLKKAYADLNVVMLTSNNEGTPVAIIEAMACGKLVLATDVGGVPDLIEYGKDGFFFPAGDSKSFIDIILDWITNRDKYIPLQSNASKKAIRLFNSERLIDETDHLYRKLFKSKDKK